MTWLWVPLSFIIIILWITISKLRRSLKAQGDLAAILREEYNKVEARVMAEAAAYIKKHEKGLRADAIKRSLNVNKGKLAEQLAPYFPEFHYNPRDCRFIGSPVDYIIFDGLADGSVKRVIFLEVKAGKYARLNKRERLVKETVNFGDVSYEVLSINPAPPTEPSEA